MNDHEIDRIAAAMHAVRPDWPAQQLRTLLRDKLADKPRRDVFVALAWVACESGTASPYRVLETGPWWKAAGVEGASSNRDNPPAHDRCGVCSLSRDRCRQVWADDHDFRPIADRKRDPDTIAEITAALRQAKAETPPPQPKPEPSTDGTERVAPVRAALAAARTEEDR